MKAPASDVTKLIRIQYSSVGIGRGAKSSCPNPATKGPDTVKTRIEAVNAISDLLKRLRVKPPWQIQFRTITNAPMTAKFSKLELMRALHAFEYEGTITLHEDNSFSVLKSPASI